MKKLIILIVVVIVLAAAGWWYVTNSATPSVPAAQPSALVPTEPTGNTPTPPPSGTPNTVTIPASGSSDSDLSQEAAEVDTQMDGLTSDNANADSGLNSQ